MELLRTPEERFTGLMGWDYPVRYADVGGVRAAYYDVGELAAPTVLLLHGEPTWSYLYRTMIPVLTGSGLRAVAVDLVGFGRSDKPADRTDYTYQAHLDWLGAVVIDHLELTGITLFCQNWGGLLGLRLVAEHPDRFDRVVASNTSLPTGRGPAPSADFLRWREFSQHDPDFDIGAIVDSACLRNLDPAEIAAYDAPFPDEAHKAGARQFPMLVPITPEDPASSSNMAAWDVLHRFDKPFLTVFSDSDPITAGGALPLLQIPGAAGQRHRTITGGHFVQEDAGPELARMVVDFVGRTT